MNDGIVANGYRNLLHAPETKARIREIHLEVQAEYEARLQQSGWIRRILLRRAMRRELWRRIDDLVPPNGLY